MILTIYHNPSCATSRNTGDDPAEWRGTGHHGVPQEAPTRGRLPELIRFPPTLMLIYGADIRSAGTASLMISIATVVSGLLLSALPDRRSLRTAAVSMGSGLHRWR
jgi:hypothetical protein